MTTQATGSWPRPVPNRGDNGMRRQGLEHKRQVAGRRGSGPGPDKSRSARTAAQRDASWWTRERSPRWSSLRAARASLPTRPVPRPRARTGAALPARSTMAQGPHGRGAGRLAGRGVSTRTGREPSAALPAEPWSVHGVANARAAEGEWGWAGMLLEASTRSAPWTSRRARRPAGPGCGREQAPPMVTSARPVSASSVWPFLRPESRGVDEPD